MTVANILSVKGRHVPQVTSQASVRDVLESLESEEVGALVVSDDGVSILGIISERDIVHGLRIQGAKILESGVTDVMTTDVATCDEDDKITAVMSLMQANRIRHVPVTDGDKLVGLVGIRDIIQQKLNEVQDDADAMLKYIAG